MAAHSDFVPDDDCQSSLTRSSVLPGFSHQGDVDKFSDYSDSSDSSGSMTPTPSDFGNPPSRNSSSSSKTMSDPFIISAPRKDVPKGPSDCYSSTGVSDPFTDSHQYIMPMVNIPHNYCQNPQVTGIDQSVAYYILQGYPVPHRPMALIYPGRMPQGLPPRPHHMFGPQQAPQMQAPRAQSYQTAQPPNPQTQTQSRPTMFHGAFQGQVTLERVAQPDVMPFANITASQSPPQWGVMKIENVSEPSSKSTLDSFCIMVRQKSHLPSFMRKPEPHN